MEKVLIVYASFGEGHTRAAHALGEHFDADVCDLLDFSFSFGKRLAVSIYLFTTQYASWFWKILFCSTKHKRLANILNAVNKIIFASFFKYVRLTKPAVIITTHFFPANLLSDIKTQVPFALFSVITDLRVHPLWVNNNVDHYFVALGVTKADLLGFGIPEERITSGVVPIRKGFLTTHSQDELYKKFNLKPRPTILFVSSLRGHFPFIKLALKVLQNDYNIFVIYGRNQRLKHYLEDVQLPGIRFFYHYNEIWELFSLSSVIVTKPGGLTIFEGLYSKKLFIFGYYIYGQEMENMELIIKQGLGLYAANEEELIPSIQNCLLRSREIGKDYPVIVDDIGSSVAAVINRLCKK